MSFAEKKDWIENAIVLYDIDRDTANRLWHDIKIIIEEEVKEKIDKALKNFRES